MVSVSLFKMLYPLVVDTVVKSGITDSFVYQGNFGDVYKRTGFIGAHAQIWKPVQKKSHSPLLLWPGLSPDRFHGSKLVVMNT